MLEAVYPRIKSLKFNFPNNDQIELTIPRNWNQGKISFINWSEYTAHLVTSTEIPTEAAYNTVSIGDGKTAGYIIPDAAILSPDNPHYDDATYCAYNIILANIICNNSRNQIYNLTSPNCLKNPTPENIFHLDAYYLVTWNKFFNSPSTLKKDFCLSLCDHGLTFLNQITHPRHLYTRFDGTGSNLKLKSTENVPEHVTTILCSLVPYCENPFLRFFYLYQIIEYFMGLELDNKISDVRSQFLAKNRPSMVEVRDILDKFQDATREKKRIKAILSQRCSSTDLSVEKLLTSLQSFDPELTMAENIYLIRNILFHNYQKIHEKADEIETVCGDLYSYLVAKKFLA